MYPSRTTDHDNIKMITLKWIVIYQKVTF